MSLCLCVFVPLCLCAFVSLCLCVFVPLCLRAFVSSCQYSNFPLGGSRRSIHLNRIIKSIILYRSNKPLEPIELIEHFERFHHPPKISFTFFLIFSAIFTIGKSFESFPNGSSISSAINSKLAST